MLRSMTAFGLLRDTERKEQLRPDASRQKNAVADSNVVERARQ